VNLKACLGLVLPYQHCLRFAPIVVWKNLGLFWGDVISWATPTPSWSLLLILSTVVVHRKKQPNCVPHAANSIEDAKCRIQLNAIHK